MFKPHFGPCKECNGEIKLLVVKAGLCKFHNELRKKNERLDSNEKNPLLFSKWNTYKGGVVKKCKKCNKDFYAHYCKKDERLYCSKKCYFETRKDNKRTPEDIKKYWEEYYKRNPDKLTIKIKKSKENYKKKNENRIKRRSEIEKELSNIHPLLAPKIAGVGKLKSGKVLSCKFCKTDFYKQPNKCLRKYCSFKCYKEDVRKNSKRICIICNSIFYCTPSQLILRNRKTCSLKCRAILQTRQAEERLLKNPPTKDKLNRRLRYSKRAKEWRISVFERDNYTCKRCGDRSGVGNKVYLQAHHIKSWAEYPELRFEVSNGETLCRSCHKKEKHPTPKWNKQKTMKGLIKELDRWFSLFIRLRNADNNGFVKCFTSGKLFHYTRCHAGHFISRRHMATRWDEYNVQVQSIHENIFNQGNAPVFAQRLKEIYGQQIVDILLMKKNNKFKSGKFELEFLIKEYKEKVEKLKLEKGL